MKRAFTLVELLVVVSVISMIGSIVLVTTASVQAKGRDAKRIQQVRQIDLAARLYIESIGHAPDLGGRCAVMQSGTPSEAQAKSCFGISTAVSGDHASAWADFSAELNASGLISQLPNDPCGSSCLSGSEFPLGYTYVAPLAMQYFCSIDPLCTSTVSQLASSYQLYAPLELQSIPSNPSSGTAYPVPGSGNNSPEETMDGPISFVGSKTCGGLTYMNDSSGDNVLRFHLAAYKTVNGQRVYSPYSTVYINEKIFTCNPGTPYQGAYYIDFDWQLPPEAEGFRFVPGHDDHFGYEGVNYLDGDDFFGPVSPELRYGISPNPVPNVLNPMVPPLPEEPSE